MYRAVSLWQQQRTMSPASPSCSALVGASRSLATAHPAHDPKVSLSLHSARAVRQHHLVDCLLNMPLYRGDGADTFSSTEWQRSTNSRFLLTTACTSPPPPPARPICDCISFKKRSVSAIRSRALASALWAQSGAAPWPSVISPACILASGPGDDGAEAGCCCCCCCAALAHRPRQMLRCAEVSTSLSSTFVLPLSASACTVIDRSRPGSQRHVACS